jgi:hypothetical protein
MKIQTAKNNPGIRYLAIALCGLTLGIPAATAVFPVSQTLVLPIAIIAPFFTMSCLESMLLSSVEA